MRTIKFRAWNKNTKQMDMVYCINGLLNSNENELKYVNCSGWEFKNIELMQFTGLFDKNLKEIYEGDIVKPIEKSGKNHNRQIVFIDGSFCYNESKTRGNRGYWALNKCKSKMFEVIGNIYENPELLNNL